MNKLHGRSQLSADDIIEGMSNIDIVALENLLLGKVKPKEGGPRKSFVDERREMFFSSGAAALFDLWIEHSDIFHYLEEKCEQDGKFPNESVWKLYLFMDEANGCLGDLFEKQFPKEYEFLMEESC